MSDLISRRTLLEALDKIPIRDMKPDENNLIALVSLAQVWNMIERLPSPKTELATEKKVGKWLDTGLTKSNMHICSECYGVHHESGYKYCPFCGTEMSEISQNKSCGFDEDEIIG